MGRRKVNGLTAGKLRKAMALLHNNKGAVKCDCIIFASTTDDPEKARLELVKILSHGKTQKN
jgi:hypothetical protein